jgi:tetratricopeptide (TPR) repeat protein
MTMRLISVLLAGLLVLAAAARAAEQMPAPVLQFDGAAEVQAQGRAWVKYRLSVVNRSIFGAELFAPAPELPPCGTNQKASRTWVNVHDGDGSGARLYGFCALRSADELGKLWFTLPKGKKPPSSVYITLTDRHANVTVASNSVGIPELPAAPAIAADPWKDCDNSRSNEVALRACTAVIDAGAMPGPKLALVYSMRATVHQRMNEPDKAIADFSAGIRLMEDAGQSDWTLAFTYFMRANVHRTKGDLDQAIADYTAAIRIAPGWDKPYNERGAVFFHLGDFGRALEDISKVISFPPDSPRVADSYAIRAMLHHRMGAPAKGLPDADRAIGFNPRSAMALYIRARIHEALGRSEEAAAGISAALAIDPGIREKMERMERMAR